ncbi:ribosomal RNA small subunit methyltransferase A [Candidatus Uhrbacteria bacterium RIFOXYC2_FULL_47_19]|uniref:Ribosomal RNA small subunit methyltransferase A n=1 Tax=Candidatus Uhrbacteria bacterium RIFOXYC2_FULL_47_19 TaxID=1802424 RepID=A0A1F7WBH1_9BACT|nr:MAG: ribosomal RNA small subunit methyltransferase A [Candidatus Uhrbacteria bacterium RIFOXYC2_FULL_47_19]HCC21947.1 ribosomal RNA small subunit methyltransferase A [Candidatus Uhrbacteria bacterium]
MKVVEIKQRLEKLGLRPTRDRGQNFLLDDSVVDDIVSVAGISEDDLVLEIGPGLGMLTKVLLSRGSRVLAVELDRALAGLLTQEIISDRLKLLIGDFLTLTNRELSAELGVTNGGFKVVANLPYSITSEALIRLLSMNPRPSGLTLMVQYEVAKRICANPPKVSALSILIRLHGEPRIIRTVSPGSFWPQPKVESAVLQVDLKSMDEVQQKLSGLTEEQFMEIVRLGFSSRRKQLKNTLVSRFSAECLSMSLTEAGIDPAERPERLTVDMWIRLASALTR